MASLACPCCGTRIPLSDISNADLKSERGRRNAARRKSFGARRKGQIAVWRAHNPSCWRCRCASCLLAGVRDLEQKIEARIAAHVANVGVAPEWAAAERALARKRRKEIEWAILARQLDDLEAADGRAA